MHLLELPPEIRNRIWKLVVLASREVKILRQPLRGMLQMSTR